MRTTARSGRWRRASAGWSRGGLAAVHAHIRQPVRGEKLQGLVLVAGGHPDPVAELYAHPVRRGPDRTGHDVSLRALEMGNHGGNCSKMAPSLPAWRSGSSAAVNRSYA
jgi:hypothetical protein